MNYRTYILIGVLMLALVLPGVVFATTLSAPDLIVSGIVRSPFTPIVGQQAIFDVQTLNDGSAPAPATSVRAELDHDADGSFEAPLGTRSVLSLIPGDSHTVSFNWTPATAGTYVFRACADSGNSVAEENEVNNCTTQVFSVDEGTTPPPATFPDLAVSSMVRSPHAPIENERITFSVQILNTGNTDASISQSRLRLDAGTDGSYETVLPLRFTSSLDPGEIEVITFLWTPFSSNNYRAQVCADVLGDIIESDETNNCSSQTFFVEKEDDGNEQPPDDFSADLRVAQNGFGWVQSFSGTAPLSGIDLRADITAGTLQPVDFVFYCDRSDGGTNITSGWDARFNGLFATRKSTFDTCNYVAPGTYTAKLIAVRNGIVQEDRATILVNQGPQDPADPGEPSNPGDPADPTGDIPDITLRAIPTSIDEGESSALTWRVRNADRCSAAGGWSGRKSTAGTRSVSPDTDTQYVLICENEFGSSSADVFVRVDEDVEQLGLVFRAAPSLIRRSETATLVWSTENADTCAASGGWSGTKGRSGSESVSPELTTTYTLSCAGDGEISTLSRTVRVSGVVTGAAPAPAPQPSFSLFCSASPQRITQGQQTVFSAQHSGGVAPVQLRWTGLASGSGITSVARPTRTGVQAATVTATDGVGRQRSVTCFVSVQAPFTPAATPVEPPSGEAPDRLTFGGFTIPAFPEDIPEDDTGFTLTAAAFDNIGSLLLYLFLILLNIALIMALIHLWRRIEEEQEKVIELEEQRLAI